MTTTPDSLPTPSTPNMLAIRRVLGADEEILEDHGLTRRGVVFYLPTARAEALLAQGPRFERAHGTE